MIKRFDDYINEGVRDLMTPISKEAIQKILDNYAETIRFANQLKNVINHTIDNMDEDEDWRLDDDANRAEWLLGELGFKYDEDNGTITPIHTIEETRKIWWKNRRYGDNEFPMGDNDMFKKYDVNKFDK